MKCIKCGNVMSDNAVFCEKCGVKIESNNGADRNEVNNSVTTNLIINILKIILFLAVFIVCIKYVYNNEEIENPYIGNWLSSDGGALMTIYEDGTGKITALSDNSYVEFSTELIGKGEILMVYIKGKQDNSCYINNSRDAFTYGGRTYSKQN